MATNSSEDHESTDFNSPAIEDLEDYLTLQSKDISIEENQNLNEIVPFKNVHTDVQPTEANQGDPHAPTVIMSDVEKDRPAERNVEEFLRIESESENNATPDHVASVKEMKEVITSGTNGRCKAVENNPGREVPQVEDWVLIIAAILKQRGKEMEWEEIVNCWVILQQNWDRVEVSQFRTQFHEGGAHLINRPTAEAT